jgi:hypothetical protein
MDPQARPRRLALLSLGALLAWGLGGCAALSGPPTLVLDEEELQGHLLRLFPQERRLLDLVDVTVARPALRLLPDRNRLSAGLELQARERLLGGTWTGRLAFDAALRWEARDQTVRLAQVRVQDLALDSAPGAFRSQGERLGAAVAELMLDDLVLYRLAGDRAQQMRLLGVAPTAVAITSRGLEITFQPTKP